VITIIAPLVFPVNHVLNKSFQIIAFLEDHTQINLAGILSQGFLPFETLAIGVDIVRIKVAHDIQALGFQYFYGVYGTRCAACVQ
jgi:uncharacterized protein involved in response to NO